ncbi:MAG: GNAT family N-acetyltransferase [Candidatus Binataceae bacterium]
MDIRIRALEERDLDEADRVVRLAFGTLLGLPDPMRMFGDVSMVRTRWHANPQGALAAEADGRFAGSNFIANWGRFGFFGPLSVLPELWDKGVARHLLDATVEVFSRWNTRIAGLFTFSDSAKHIALYQKFGFWPRCLTVVSTRPIANQRREIAFERFSVLSAADKPAAIAECREVTGAIGDGLDLRIEIESVDRQKLGDTILLRNGAAVCGFAVCHAGAGTEAGSDTCYVKFGAVAPGTNAPANFERLLDACESYASSVSVSNLKIGVNTARLEAYRAILARGVRFEIIGVAMLRDGDDGYNRPGVFVIDDWR